MLNNNTESSNAHDMQQPQDKTFWQSVVDGIGSIYIGVLNAMIDVDNSCNYYPEDGDITTYINLEPLGCEVIPYDQSKCEDQQGGIPCTLDYNPVVGIDREGRLICSKMQGGQDEDRYIAPLHSNPCAACASNLGIESETDPNFVTYALPVIDINAFTVNVSPRRSFTALATRSADDCRCLSIDERHAESVSRIPVVGFSKDGVLVYFEENRFVWVFKNHAAASRDPRVASTLPVNMIPTQPDDN